MRKITLTLPLTLTLALSGCANYQDSGTITGAAVGGLLGNQIGGGSGKAAATVIGIMAGAKIGGNIGASMDEVNRMKANDALNKHPQSQSTWTDSKTQQHYAITPEDKVYEHEGRVCKDYTLSVTIDGKPEQATGVACRNRYGEWVIVK